MAQQSEQYDARRELLKILLNRVDRDRYPSATMMDLVEQLMGPDERSVYAKVLLNKIGRDPHPSLSLMRRVMALG
jgi:hypothetical protein